MSRTVLVTGATRGIGREVTKQLCAQGFTVFATGRDQQLLSALKKETGCLGAVCDLSDSDAAVALYAQAQAELGRIDVLINNAGFNPGKEPITEVDVARMDASYAVNFRASFLLCREALKEMARARADIFLMSSARSPAPAHRTIRPIAHSNMRCMGLRSV